MAKYFAGGHLRLLDGAWRDDAGDPVDIEPVVRCKDCAVPHNKWTGCPNLNGLIPPPDFFCARGERKDGE